MGFVLSPPPLSGKQAASGLNLNTGHFWHTQGVTEELKQWDISFWAERLREQRFAITDEELRPYFALPNVLNGLFKVCT
jgi:Zn-dependent oligopeptidase